MDCKLTKKQQDFLLKNLSPRVVEFPKNCVISQETSRLQVGLILSGMVYLCAENENCDRNILSFFREGEYFTHNMLIPIDNGISYLTTKSKTKIAYISRIDLLKYKSESIDWIIDISNTLCKISDHNFLYRNYLLHQKSVRSKLMMFFKNEVEIQESKTITVPIPFTDLADYLSIERTAMMKEIKKLKDEEIIIGKNRKLKIKI
jgi:CRP-like cAMP-binding protein